MSGSTHLQLSPLYWPSLRVRTQYRVFLGFTHSLELLLLLNGPRMLRQVQGGEEAGRGGRISSPLSILIRGKNRKILSFLAFRPEGPHLCISYLRSKKRKEEKGSGTRGCGCCPGQSQESTLSDLSPPRAAVSRLERQVFVWKVGADATR